MALKLFLLRHGEAVSSHSNDILRELTPAGRVTIADVGDAMIENGLTPDKVLVSPAKRTQQTFEILNRKVPLNATTVKGLYEWDARGIIYHLSSGAASAPSMMIVGHNPALSGVVEQLAGTPMHMTPGQLVVLTNSLSKDWYEMEGASWAIERTY
ncbi:MAG: histidine phosphatase family protein [Oligoflexales bacterium]